MPQVVPIRVLLAGVGDMLRASKPQAATVDAGRRASKPPATVDAGRLFVAGVRRLVYERSLSALKVLLALVDPRPAETIDAFQQAQSLAADVTPVTDLSATQSRLRVLTAPPHAPSRVLCPAGAAG